MTMSTEQKLARIKELEKAIDAAPGWGAAVGAMSEELRALKRSLT